MVSIRRKDLELSVVYPFLAGREKRVKKVMRHIKFFFIPNGLIYFTNLQVNKEVLSLFFLFGFYFYF